MTKEELKPIDVSKYTVTESGNVIKDKLKQEAFNWTTKELEKEELKKNHWYEMYELECLKTKNLGNQLTKAKDHIKRLLDCLRQDTNDPQTNYYVGLYMTKAEQFLKDSEVEK